MVVKRRSAIQCIEPAVFMAAGFLFLRCPLLQGVEFDQAASFEKVRLVFRGMP